jgi:hypothetical protein
VLQRKKKRIFLRDGFLVYKINGSSFPSGAYKELATFPNEWEVWKRLLQGVVSFQVWKSVIQVFKFQILSSKVCEREF